LTRHNVGFRVVDRLCENLDVSLKKPWFSPFLFGMGGNGNSRIFLAKPLTFMNRSGKALPAILRRSSLPRSALLVVFDTLDLPVGAIRLKKRGSSGGHNGLKSVIASLESEDFMRFAVGIGRPKQGSDIIGHVLGIPDGEESGLLGEAVAKTADGIVRLLHEEPESVMNEINRT